MKTVHYPASEEWSALSRRPVSSIDELYTIVGPILRDVKSRGDAAVAEFTRRFDGTLPATVQVHASEIAAAASQLPERLRQAIMTAHRNIETFHRSQVEDSKTVETMPGVRCWRRSVPIQSVGLYIPGGTSPLFSSVLMLGIPAKIAGCRDLVLCTPPDAQGKVHPAILFCATLAGITKIFRIGGAQAIAAMAYGTESVPRVMKVFGPGNQYVTAAKQMVSQEGIAIDLPAGPSELVVMADASANPAFVAADLLSQAEHGPDSQVLLVTDDPALPQRVADQVDLQLEHLPRREIARQSLRHSRMLVFKSIAEATAFVNFYAPEHLILSVYEAANTAAQIINAGSVFLGNYTPESAGDYASGTNHTLPTNGAATAYSGVSLDSFVKKITFQEISEQGLRNVGPAVEEMALAEGLTAHRQAVRIRLDSLDGGSI